MRQNVLGLTVVLPSGQVIRTGGRARKSAAGYDLTALFVGSEGTLGVITEVTLRLYGQPESTAAAVCSFETVRDAVDAVIETIQLGVPVARIELLDALQMRALNAYNRTDRPERPTLFLDFHGSPAAVAEQAALFGEIADGHGRLAFGWATEPEARTALWSARHKAHGANLALKPGCRSIATDVCVPISHLADCIAEAQAAIAESGLIAPIVGHVGDGNFHVVMLLDPDSAEDAARGEALSHAIVRSALAHGGTCTGEHGVGLHKKGYLVEEHGPAVDLMRVLKAAVDPLGIMNPGKVVDV
jgi:D-lactate dehydrogenase (cytochrome)